MNRITKLYIELKGLRKNLILILGFPYISVCKESGCNAGDPGSIPGLGRFPGGGNGNPLQRIPWTEEPGKLST